MLNRHGPARAKRGARQPASCVCGWGGGYAGVICCGHKQRLITIHVWFQLSWCFCPKQAIRVLGLLGALDPYKHKVNIGMIDQSRDASAVSLSESKSSQDSGRPGFPFFFMPPTVWGIFHEPSDVCLPTHVPSSSSFFNLTVALLFSFCFTIIFLFGTITWAWRIGRFIAAVCFPLSVS